MVAPSSLSSLGHSHEYLPHSKPDLNVFACHSVTHNVLRLRSNRTSACCASVSEPLKDSPIYRSFGPEGDARKHVPARLPRVVICKTCYNLVVYACLPFVVPVDISPSNTPICCRYVRIIFSVGWATSRRRSRRLAVATSPEARYVSCRRGPYHPDVEIHTILRSITSGVHGKY